MFLSNVFLYTYIKFYNLLKLDKSIILQQWLGVQACIIRLFYNATWLYTTPLECNDAEVIPLLRDLLNDTMFTVITFLCVATEAVLAAILTLYIIRSYHARLYLRWRMTRSPMINREISKLLRQWVPRTNKKMHLFLPLTWTASAAVLERGLRASVGADRRESVVRHKLPPGMP